MRGLNFTKKKCSSPSSTFFACLAHCSTNYKVSSVVEYPTIDLLRIADY